MEKTIIIDSRPVTFKATGGLPYRYKAQFGREYLADVVSIEAVFARHNIMASYDPESATEAERHSYERSCALALSEVPLDIMCNILWCMAKAADDKTPSPQVWLDGFNVFPIFDIWEQVKDIADGNLSIDPKNA